MESSPTRRLGQFKRPASGRSKLDFGSHCAKPTNGLPSVLQQALTHAVERGERTSNYFIRFLNVFKWRDSVWTRPRLSRPETASSSTADAEMARTSGVRPASEV